MSAIAPAEHLDWAKYTVALPVARRYGLCEQEVDDVVQVAVLALYKFAARRGKKAFDPTRVPAGGDVCGAFRGLAYRTIHCACVRAVQEMRGGGTFRTVRPENLVTADPLGDAAEAVFEPANSTAREPLYQCPECKELWYFPQLLPGVVCPDPECGRQIDYERDQVDMGSPTARCDGSTGSRMVDVKPSTMGRQLARGRGRNPPDEQDPGFDNAARIREDAP